MHHKYYYQDTFAWEEFLSMVRTIDAKFGCPGKILQVIKCSLTVTKHWVSQSSVCLHHWTNFLGKRTPKCSVFKTTAEVLAWKDLQSHHSPLPLIRAHRWQLFPLFIVRSLQYSNSHLFKPEANFCKQAGLGFLFAPNPYISLGVDFSLFCKYSGNPLTQRHPTAPMRTGCSAKSVRLTKYEHLHSGVFKKNAVANLQLHVCVCRHATHFQQYNWVYCLCFISIWNDVLKQNKDANCSNTGRPLCV